MLYNLNYMYYIHFSNLYDNVFINIILDIQIHSVNLNYLLTNELVQSVVETEITSVTHLAIHKHIVCIKDSLSYDTFFKLSPACDYFYCMVKEKLG